MPLIRCYRSCAPLNLCPPRVGEAAARCHLVHCTHVAEAAARTSWRPGGHTVVSSALSALRVDGTGGQQLLEQHLLITMAAASPFRRMALPKPCLFGSTHGAAAQEAAGSVPSHVHDFSRSLSGWGS